MKAKITDANVMSSILKVFMYPKPRQIKTKGNKSLTNHRSMAKAFASLFRHHGTFARAGLKTCIEILREFLDQGKVCARKPFFFFFYFLFSVIFFILFHVLLLGFVSPCYFLLFIIDPAAYARA